MRRFLASIIALFASIAILLLGVGLMGSLLSIRLNFEAIDPQVKGLILSAYYIGLVAGSQSADRVIRQAGHIRAFAIFAAVCTAVILLKGLYVLPAAWFVLRLIIGFSIAGVYMVVESWLNERADRTSRGRVFSLYQITAYVALGIGQFLLHLGDPASAELFMIVGLLFALCLVPVALSRASNPPEPAPHVPMALRQTLTGSPVAAWTCLASGLSSGAVFTLT
ncbi:MAG: MFS transporter, partial [Ectothiorhodospiraceae bacterium]|nr:MFS transporter [Ectothiorhodospiraceae bacterium]